MNYLILLTLFVIAVIIHEFGHYIVAKLFRGEVYEFSIGFGPKLLQKKYGTTYYTLRALPFPIGGYVSADIRNFTLYQKLIYAFAGIFANYITAVLALAPYFNIGYWSGVFKGIGYIPNSIYESFYTLSEFLNFENTLGKNATFDSTISTMLTTLQSSDALLFFAKLNVVLVIINLIPIPPLDGFHIIWSIAQRIASKLGIPKEWIDHATKILLISGFILILAQLVLPYIFFYIDQAGLNPMSLLTFLLALLCCEFIYRCIKKFTRRKT